MTSSIRDSFHPRNNKLGKVHVELMCRAETPPTPHEGVYVQATPRGFSDVSCLCGKNPDCSRCEAVLRNYWDRIKWEEIPWSSSNGDCLFVPSALSFLFSGLVCVAAMKASRIKLVWRHLKLRFAGEGIGNSCQLRHREFQRALSTGRWIGNFSWGGMCLPPDWLRSDSPSLGYCKPHLHPAPLTSLLVFLDLAQKPGHPQLVP